MKQDWLRRVISQKKAGAYTLFWSGGSNICKKEEDAAVTVRDKIALKVQQQLPIGYSERIMNMRYP